LKWLIAIVSLFILVGCGNGLEREATERAREAMAVGDYEGGSLLLLAGSEQLHEQSIYLLRMLNHYDEDNLFEMFLAWLSLMRLEAGEDFVREAALGVMSDAMTSGSD